jgi:hypothetical protein
VRLQRIGDIHAFRDRLEVPGLGYLPVNAFLISAQEPVLVDSGLAGSKSELLDALRSVLDLRELRWIWLTHPDRDHIGALYDVLAAAPNARLVSTFGAVGYLGLEREVPADRVTLVDPGQSLPIGGGRSLHAFRPPLYDSPMTVGFVDDGNGACFTSDCFGAMLPTLAEADADDLGELPAEQVRAGQVFWAGVDSPWVHAADPARFALTYESLRRFAPSAMFSAHLPPAPGRFDDFVDLLEVLPTMPATETGQTADALLERAISDQERLQPQE